MFKQLANVRPSGAGRPELITTPTSGTLKINGPAASHINVGNGDYVSVLEDTDTNSEWKGLWLVKGNAGDDKNAQFGSKLASASGKNTAGALAFSSENAYNVLKGNSKTKMVYSIGEGKTHPDFATPLYPLTFVREDEKSEKKPKGVKTAKA